MENITSVEFLDRLQEKEIKNIYMQYSDLTGHEFKDVVIKDSKFFFVVFRRCSFKNVVFENCEFFFCAFGYTDSENLVFKKCKMEYSGFTEAMMKDCKFISTSLSWHSFINTTPGFELRNCTQFNIFRKTEDIYPLIDKGLEELQPILNTMDFDTRHNVMTLLETLKRNTKLNREINFNFTATEKTGSYESSKKGYGMFDSLIDSAITAYGTKPVYKTGKGAYEARSGYKK